MSLNIQELVKTHFYHPALNCAVFDGPLRIYFNQSQESLALKVYFFLQKEVEKILKQYDGTWYFVVLLYPDVAIYREKLLDHREEISNDLELPFVSRTFGADKLILTHAYSAEVDTQQLSEGLQRELTYLIKTHSHQQYAYVV
ncbi:MAG: hypothetical protein NZ480_07260 [Bdellovibrionaceae bacterium]|nr:hypothetical protein [Pseudobdellovibrionaceae bacterium]MDW8191029.1 hypothetical protein [Pseudobdellovibrionaceae bacterium]